MEWDNESIVKQLQAGQDIITALHTAHTETLLKRLQVSSCTCMGRMSIYRTPEITQKGHGKMEELKKSIKQKEKELEKKKAECQVAKVEEFAALDRDILMLELQIKQMEESQHIQELREKGETPMDELTRARLHMAELIDQLCEEGRDMNGSGIENPQGYSVTGKDLELAVYGFMLALPAATARQPVSIIESCVFTEEKQQEIGIPPGILPPFAYWVGFEIHDPGIWEMVLQSDFPVFTIEITGNTKQG